MKFKNFIKNFKLSNIIILNLIQLGCLEDRTFSKVKEIHYNYKYKYKYKFTITNPDTTI